MTLHTIPPVWDENSKVLILGSFPSVKSREEGFSMGISKIGFGRWLPMFATALCLKILMRKKQCSLQTE